MNLRNPNIIFRNHKLKCFRLLGCRLNSSFESLQFLDEIPNSANTNLEPC